MLQVCGKTIFELYVTTRMNLVEMKLSDFDDADVLEKINVCFSFTFEFILHFIYINTALIIQTCENYEEELDSVAHLGRLCPFDAANVLNEAIKLRVKVVFDSFLLNTTEIAPQVLLALKQLGMYLFSFVELFIHYSRFSILFGFNGFRMVNRNFRTFSL